MNTELPSTAPNFDKHLLVDTCVKLPLTIDANRALAEIQSIPAYLWGEKRAAKIHDDSVRAVFVKGYAPQERKPDEERPILKELPYLRSLVYSLLPGTPGKCVIAALKPNGRVLMHRDGHVYDPTIVDPINTYFRDTLRIHFPILTNPSAIFFCNGEFFHMGAGEVWAVNNLSDHAVINDDPASERIHVILDVFPTEATLNLVRNSDRANGWKDRALIARIMADSYSPPESLYARGKPIPADY